MIETMKAESMASSLTTNNRTCTIKVDQSEVTQAQNKPYTKLH